MFKKFAKTIHKVLPFTLAYSAYLLNTHNHKVELSAHQKNYVSNSSKVKIIKDIGEYSYGENQLEKTIILCELSGQPFIDDQLIQIAEQFVKYADAGNVSKTYQFLFLREIGVPGQLREGQYQSYFVIYNTQKQKMVNVEPYLNKDQYKPYLKIKKHPLFKRLVETINGQRQISLSNLAQELQVIQNTSNYSALIAIPPNQSDSSKGDLDKYLKTHEIKSKYCSKFIVRDQQSKSILGLSNKPPGLYLVSSLNLNIRSQKKQNSHVYKIGEKQFIVSNIDENLNQTFVFPPIQSQLAADKIVLNVYINKNHNTSEIQQKIYSELSKPQYSNFQKSIYYTDQVQSAALQLSASNYSKLSLTAYDPSKPLSPTQAKDILLNTFQWILPISSADQINTNTFIQWITQNTGENKMKNQYYKSEKQENKWSTPLTGIQYKQKRDGKGDKIIYHYSQHCHGCKKFGGKFQQFARLSSNYPKLSFYRINNDYNKGEGIRNFNTTPVFAYYKQGYDYPFVYKMPIFTQALFDSFLNITGSIQLFDSSILQQSIRNKAQSQTQIQELLKEIS